MNNLAYNFFKRSVVAVERRTAKGFQSNWPWLQGGNANAGPRDEDDAVLLTRYL